MPVIAGMIVPPVAVEPVVAIVPIVVPVVAPIVVDIGPIVLPQVVPLIPIVDATWKIVVDEIAVAGAVWPIANITGPIAYIAGAIYTFAGPIYTVAGAIARANSPTIARSCRKCVGSVPTAGKIARAGASRQCAWTITADAFAPCRPIAQKLCRGSPGQRPASEHSAGANS